MGMIGTYVAVDNDFLKRVLEGEQELEAILDEDPYPQMDIDKSWQAMHYLFCRDVYNGTPPAGFVVPMREDRYLDFDADFDAFYLKAEEVEEVCRYLDGLSDEDLKAMYDFPAMVKDEVYIVGEDDDPEDVFEYLTCHLTALKEFYRETVEENHAVIFYIM